MATGKSRNTSVDVNKNALVQGISTDTYINRLSVALKGGYIWIDEQREILMSTPLLSEMLRVIYEAGERSAIRLISDMGHNSGARWARNDLKRNKLANSNSILEAIYYVAQLCGLVGYGELRLASRSVDGEGGQEITLHLHSGVEVEACLMGGRIGTKCCYLTVAFISGYMNEIFSNDFEFFEESCKSEGHDFCRIIGRPKILGSLLRVHSENALELSNQSRKGVDASLDDGGLAQNLSIIGVGGGLKEIYRRLAIAAPTTATLLLHGETGVGKEVFAREAHRLSGRSGDFVSFNGGALPDTLVESELFGVEKGAFSGADRARVGRFERADNGTLFIDEVASLSLSAQVKLLRVIQEGEIERLGGIKTTKINVRLICASNVDLQEAVRLGNFRQDLYFRISTLKLVIPALRERRQDIPELVNYYLNFFSRKYARSGLQFSDEFLQALLNYDYPGNVRELASIVEASAIMAPDHGVMDLSQIAYNFPGLSNCALSLGSSRKNMEVKNPENVESEWLTIAERFLDHGVTVEDVQSVMLVAALRNTGNNITKAAKLLGVSRRQLSYLINKPQVSTRFGGRS
jgi:DNA-binding NtrC family response regulator